jgi:acetoin utilization protein AcuB
MSVMRQHKSRQNPLYGSGKNIKKELKPRESRVGDMSPVNTATTTPETTVGEVMTTDLVTLKLDDTLRLADDLMNLTQVHHFPVLDGDAVAGVINQNDLLHASMVSLVRHRQDAVRDALGEVKVKAVMKPATMVSSDMSINEAARIMVERELECLLVLEGEKLAGLVSRTDLLRELAKQ